MTIATADAVLRFWLEDCTPADWYRQDDALDEAILARFHSTWAAARGLRNWCAGPDGALAFLILTDQFPRNMFRGQRQAFATDTLALAAAKSAIRRGFDLSVADPQRQFFYLPLEHSEVLPDQARAVRLIQMRLASEDTLLHARAHRAVIRAHGRFPYRNAALDRSTTRAEHRMLQTGGYGAAVRRLQAADVASEA